MHYITHCDLHDPASCLSADELQHTLMPNVTTCCAEPTYLNLAKAIAASLHMFDCGQAKAIWNAIIAAFDVFCRKHVSLVAGTRLTIVASLFA